MSTGIWAVSLEVLCTRLPCSVKDEATVRSTNCEDARTGAMKVLRYRGWLLGGRDATLCPKHAGPMPCCVRCDDPTPRLYLDTVPWTGPELADLAKPTLLCPGCRRWARELWLTRLHTEREAAQ
ncbi:MAG TPA: hypothetical protein VGL39_27640 [Jatrophihabitantaceae bacterium]|jgi:hypothetical protein